MKHPLVPALLCALAWSWTAQAQAQSAPEPRNVVQLTASAQKEVPQDWLTLVLVVRHQASDAATVQNQLKQVLDQALAKARPRVQPGALELSTGGFSVQPRYGREGQVVGWQGSAELLLQGRDTARLTQLAGELPGLSMAQMAFSLSRDAARKLESEIRQEAIANFRTTAQDVAKGFGFAAYTLREVSVHASGAEVPIQARARMVSSEAVGAAFASTPVPAEAGKSTVQVTVTGSVQLQ